MNDFETVKKYFINIDFDIVDNSEVLDNVYKEIKGYEEKLILNLESVPNFELLVQKSNIQQIEKFCKNINIHFLSLKKTGSKFLEVLYTKIHETKDVKNDLIYKSAFSPIVDNFKEIFVDKNGTHVIRKFFICFHSENLQVMNNFKNDIIEILENSISIDVLITIIHYLKIVPSKKVLRVLIRKFFKPEYIFNKLYTYIFEDIINLIDEKSLKLIFETIKPHFKEYMNDKFGVFLILALIKNFPNETEFYFSQCEIGMKNSNVLLKVTENFCKLKKIEKVQEILTNFYGFKNDIFKNFLLNHTESPDTKYINLVILFMEMDLFYVNEDFTKYFKAEWAHKKFGLSLLLGFFEGGADDKLKSTFAKELNLSSGLNKKKEGKKIFSLVKSYKKYIK
ncbi:pumilio 23-like protein [Vairimorpha necatrix]|uniref:Nucleolar protein 9 n=1 Tax=Vairimorpha necatrix TaxID=6039 RepID=A0AAX4JAX3_9MICR